MQAEVSYALNDAACTDTRAEQLIAALGSDDIAIAQRQRQELIQFIEVYRKDLKKYHLQLQQTASDIDRQLLTMRRMELEESLRFVERAFVAPRTLGGERQVLEAADWVCVDGFRFYMGDDPEHPIGPIVAIDSAQSPAVWAPDASLPIPSLFQTEPKTIDRSKSLAPFPVICLPGHLAQSPEFYPLLAHEVGHAIDHAVRVTDEILVELAHAKSLSYWTAWMREIVADAVAIALTGEAFVIALERYLDVMPPHVEVTTATAYPCNNLRLAFLGACLQDYSASPLDDFSLPTERDLKAVSRKAVELLREFREQVLPVIAKLLLGRNQAWLSEQSTVRNLAEQVTDANCPTWADEPFRLMPSVITVAQRNRRSDSARLDTYERFRLMHSKIPSAKRPAWIGEQANWKFTEEYLPSLRPTLLGGTGNFKVPPRLLMVTHHKIAFVAATNWQLFDGLSEAFQKRQAPWHELHIFFASETLLEQVEYGQQDAVDECNKAKVQLEQALRNNGWAKSWTLYEFSGPPLFASYWDWDARGGRIHISPALLGTHIGECPAADHIWMQATPTDHYQKYVKHLQALLDAASPARSGVTRSKVTILATG